MGMEREANEDSIAPEPGKQTELGWALWSNRLHHNLGRPHPMSSIQVLDTPHPILFPAHEPGNTENDCSNTCLLTLT